MGGMSVNGLHLGQQVVEVRFERFEDQVRASKIMIRCGQCSRDVELFGILIVCRATEVNPPIPENMVRHHGCCQLCGIEFQLTDTSAIWIRALAVFYYGMVREIRVRNNNPDGQALVLRAPKHTVQAIETTEAAAPTWRADESDCPGQYRPDPWAGMDALRKFLAVQQGGAAERPIAGLFDDLPGGQWRVLAPSFQTVGDLVRASNDHLRLYGLTEPMLMQLARKIASLLGTPELLAASMA